MAHASVSVDWPGARIPEYVRDLESVVMAVISRDGMLIDANRGFFELLPPSLSAADVLDVRDLFVNPRFDQFATRRGARAGGVLYRGLMNIGDIRGPVTSLKGVLYALQDSVLIVAEQGVAGLDLLRMRLLDLNDELAEEQRKLAAVIRESKRQTELAEGAIRERDALQAQIGLGAN